MIYRGAKMNELLKKYVDMAAYVNDFTEDDLAVTVSDKEKVIKCIPGKNVKLRVEEGQLLNSELALFQSMEQRKKVTVFISKEIHGVPMTATAIPIIDEDRQIVGSIATVKNISDREELHGIIQTLADSLNEMSKSATQISMSAEKIAFTGEDMITSVNSALTRAKETDQVVQFVRHVAQKTNLLGLNAAIEAARAGDVGRGFQVVAEEIRKLAASSNVSVDKIASVLKEIQGSVIQILEMVEENGSLTQQQAAGTEEIKVKINELSKLADKLNEFAHRI